MLFITYWKWKNSYVVITDDTNVIQKAWVDCVQWKQKQDIVWEQRPLDYKVLNKLLHYWVVEVASYKGVTLHNI